MLLSDWDKTVLLPPKPQYSCGHAPVDNAMHRSTWHCSRRQNHAPVGKTMLMPPKQCSFQTGTKQCLCRQNNAPVDKTMLMPTNHARVDKKCSYRHNKAPVGLGRNSAPAKTTMLLWHAPVDKLCSGRHSMVPVDKNMLMSTKQYSSRQNTATVDKTMLTPTKQCSR